MPEGIQNILHLIEATDLVQFADSRVSEGKLPEIIRRLITSTCDPDYIRMPSGDSVRYAGWDGIVNYSSSIKNPYVPNGNSYWEFSISRTIGRKAESDFNKRTNSISENSLSESIFIFITLRRWRNKDSWANEKRNSSKWKDIKVYDADDLEHWLEITPSVDLWLAKYRGKLPSDNALPLSIFWEEWISSTDPPLDEDLILKLLPNSLEKINEFLTDAKNNYLSISSIEKDIAIAYFTAVILSLKSEVHKHSFLSRSIIVKDIGDFRKLALPGHWLILIPTFDGAPISTAINNGHKVLYPKIGGINKDQEILLRRVSTDDIAKYLITKGQIPEFQAKRISSMSHGSISILRRRIAKEGHIKSPEWTLPEKAIQILPIVLAGSWDSNCKGDKEIISILGNKPYNQIESIAHLWCNVENPPIKKIGSVYTLSSYEYVYKYLFKYITPSLLDYFYDVCITVFSELDPKYEMEIEQRLLAPLRGNIYNYSFTLRKGLAISLVLLRTCPPDDLGDKTTTILQKIFHKLYYNQTSWKFWASIADAQTLFAEASPEIFLNSIKNVCRTINDDFKDLFMQTTSLGGCYYADLLWALEGCAWNPIFLDQVAEILILLTHCEDVKSNWANRPSRSLSSIFLLRYPQTSASLQDRFNCIDGLLEKYPKEIMHLLFSILPSNMEMIIPTHKPKYYDWADNNLGPVSIMEVNAGIKMVLERIPALIAKYPEGWIKIIDKIWDIPFKEDVEQLLDALIGIELETLDKDQKIDVWTHLDKKIHFHKKYHPDFSRQYNDIITKLEKAYEHFTPKDPCLKWSRVFSPDVYLHITETKDWREESRLISNLQIKAVNEVYTIKNIDGLVQLSELVDHPAFVGKSAASLEELVKNDFQFILSYIDNENINIKELLRGFILKRYEREGINWVKDFLNKIVSEKQEEILTFFFSLPFEKEIWDLLKSYSSTTNDLYWERIQINRYFPKNEEIEFIAGQLLKHNRAAGAFYFLSRLIYERSIKINPELFLSVLKSLGDREDDPDIQIIRHNIGHNFKIMIYKLAENPVIDQKELALIEWKLMPFSPYGGTPTNLIKWILLDASVFSEIIQNTFYPDDSTSLEKQIVTKQQEEISYRGRDLLNLIKDIPGFREDGILNYDDLKDWITKARELCKKNNRLMKCDQYIGRFLAYSPSNPDDNCWPHKIIRDLLDEIDIIDIVRGLETGLYNKRGGTMKGLYEGGKQERELAEQYRRWADQCRGKWRRITEVLNNIASTYYREAEFNDIRAEQERHFEE